MDSSAANRIPDEIVSEILTPLLKHSDEVFRDQSEKALLDPDHSASRYLLVSKSWLRVSTPLLYNVVILRTTAQAEALQTVLKTNKEFGLFIKKLRVEGGFGNAMHIILKNAPNITDLYLTLYIGGFDRVDGLCSGLPLINPRRVIVVDAAACSLDIQPKKNKKVTELLETLVSLIPKWDKMRTFQFPYLAGFDGARDSILDLRAVALASALVKSPSLETLILGLGNSFPGYLRQMVDAPSLKSINFTIFPHPERTSAGWGLPFIREDVDGDAKLKALVSYQELDDADQAELLENNRNFMSTNSDSDVEAYGSDEDVDGNYWSKNCLTYLHSLSELEKLGDTFGSTVKRLHVSSHAKSANIDLTPFTSLVSLSWLGTANQYSFAAPGSAVSTLPVLEELSVGGGNPLLLHLVKLPLDSLRTVELTEHGPGTMAFIRSHGTKLRELGVTTETIAEAAVFDVCASLNTLTIHPSWDGKSLEYMALTENFMVRSTPHASLTRIRYANNTIARSHLASKARREVAAAIPLFEQLNPENFPGLKQIEIHDIEWPTSEQQARKDPWLPLSKMMHQKGIKLTDKAGVSGPTGTRVTVSTGARAKRSTRRR